MVNVLIKFIVVISFIVSFEIGVCISMEVVIGVGLRDGIMVTNVPSMDLCSLFKTFQLSCPFVIFNRSKPRHIITSPKNSKPF
jgi:hypothetical protein